MPIGSITAAKVASRLFTAFTSKLFGGLLILALVTLGPALYFTRDKLFDARERVQQLTDWQFEMVDAIRLASNNPKVTTRTAKAQVQELGFIRIKLTNAIEDQNAAIVMMEQQSQAAMAAAARARKQRAAATRRAEALAQELRNRARVPAPAANMEAEVRRTQDELYEAGI